MQGKSLYFLSCPIEAFLEEFIFMVTILGVLHAQLG